VTCATPNIIAVHEHRCGKDVTTSQSGKDIRKDYLDLSQEGDAQDNSDTVRSLSTTYAPPIGHERGTPYTPLRTRVLYKHNLQQAHISRLLESQHASRHGPVAELEAAVISADNLMHGLHNEGSGGSNNNDLPVPPSRTQSQQHRTSSLYNEVGCDTPNYQSTSLWRSRSACQDNVMDIQGPYTFDVDPPSWDLDQDHELTAWGNALAGVGVGITRMLGTPTRI
jgi:hypothetical protein